jgi:hypothetical protein
MLDENNKSKWYLNPIVVILLLFFVLGPIGLPLLYKSPHFGKASKIILTIITIIYTVYLIYVSLEIALKLYRSIEELQGLTG